MVLLSASVEIFSISRLRAFLDIFCLEVVVLVVLVVMAFEIWLLGVAFMVVLLLIIEVFKLTQHLGLVSFFV